MNWVNSVLFWSDVVYRVYTVHFVLELRAVVVSDTTCSQYKNFISLFKVTCRVARKGGISRVSASFMSKT